MNLLKKVSAALLCSVLVLTAFPAAISANDGFSEEASAQDVYVSDIPYDDIAFDDDDFDEAEGFGETEIISRTVENGVERTSYRVNNWTIAANSTSQRTTKMSLKTGDYMFYDFKLSPVPSNGEVRIGVYNSDNSTYYSSPVSGSSYKTNRKISADGTFVVRVKNSTDTAITITGTYEAAVFSGGASLNVPQYKQEDTNWCWAACTQMCAKYFDKNNTISQTQIVENVKGGVYNHTAKPEDYPKAMEFATGNEYTAVRSEGYWFMWQIRNELNDGIPIIMALQKSNGKHAVVITAADNDADFIRVNDPANGSVKVYRHGAITSTGANEEYIATIDIDKK